MSCFYVSDLDGTLLRNDASLSESSRKQLTQLLADGLPFSVASARSVVSIRNVLGDLRLELPVIEFNGAFLSDLRTGRHEVVNALDGALAGEIYAEIRRTGFEPIVSTFDGSEDGLYLPEARNEGERYYLEHRRRHRDPRLRPGQPTAVGLDEQVVCLTVIGEPAPLQELESLIRERFGAGVELHLFENAYSPGWYWLTIHDRRASKDQAVQLLRDRYDLAAHELIVFGDHSNDLKLFRIAAQAVAVSNAVAEIKAIATRIIGSNEEDSVVRYIREHHLGRRRGG